MLLKLTYTYEHPDGPDYQHKMRKYTILGSFEGITDLCHVLSYRLDPIVKLVVLEVTNLDGQKLDLDGFGFPRQCARTIATKLG